MKKLLFGLLGLGMLFSACKKDDLSSLSINIEGIVYDTKTDAVLSGVLVKVTSKEKTDTTTTDANGFFSLESLPSGTYSVTYSIDGYLISIDTVSSEELPVNTETESVTYNSTISLIPLSESLSFTVFKYYNDYSTTASNQSFTVSFNKPGNESFTGTTDANGLIELTNMPFNSIIFITFDFEIEEIRYYDVFEINPSDFSSNYAMIYGYSIEGKLGLVSSNILDNYGDGVDDFNVTSDITFNFTQPIDTASASVSLGNYSDSYEEQWSADFMTLTIHPTSDLAYNTSYYVYLSLNNENKTDSYTPGYIYFKTEEE